MRAQALGPRAEPAASRHAMPHTFGNYLSARSVLSRGPEPAMEAKTCMGGGPPAVRHPRQPLMRCIAPRFYTPASAHLCSTGRRSAYLKARSLVACASQFPEAAGCPLSVQRAHLPNDRHPPGNVHTHGRSQSVGAAAASVAHSPLRHCWRAAARSSGVRHYRHHCCWRLPSLQQICAFEGCFSRDLTSSALD